MNKFLTSDPVGMLHPLDPTDPRYWDYEVVRSKGLFRTAGEYNLELTNGKFKTFLTVDDTCYRITRTLPNHVVDAIYRLAAGRYPITLEFIVEFLKRSNDEPILEHSIVIPPHVRKFFDDLKLPQDQSALLHSKLAKAKFEYENALKLLDEIDERIRDEKSKLAILEERNSKMYEKYQTMQNDLDKTNQELDALIAFNLSVQRMEEEFGQQFTLLTIGSSLPTIDDLQKRISDLNRDITSENWTFQPARYNEVSKKKSLLESFNRKLKDAEKIKEQSLRQLEKIQLDIQLKKLGLT